VRTMNASDPSPSRMVLPSPDTPIIVATDGRPPSDAALVMGRVLCDDPRAIRTVTVLRPVPAFPDGPASVNADVETTRRADAKRRVVSQMRRVWPYDTEIEIYDGDPARVLGSVAREANASLIVAGIGRHQVPDRLFGSETVLRLIRVADRPVLAVADAARERPRRIVVATDFSETSERAASLALEIAGRGAAVFLTHVAPRDTSTYATEGMRDAYHQAARDALRQMRDRLGVRQCAAIETLQLCGDPVVELLAFAGSVGADLIATGSHGHGVVVRMLIGSVATKLIRLATCSVLTVPHSAVAS